MLVNHKSCAADGTWLGVRFCRHKICAQPCLTVLQVQNIAPAFKSLTKQRGLLGSAAHEKTALNRAGFFSAQRTGLEPATSRVTGGCSNQLSYHCRFLYNTHCSAHAQNTAKTFCFQQCVGGRTCTSDLGFMSPML